MQSFDSNKITREEQLANWLQERNQGSQESQFATPSHRATKKHCLSSAKKQPAERVLKTPGSDVLAKPNFDAPTTPSRRPDELRHSMVILQCQEAAKHEDYSEGHSTYETIYKKHTPWINNKSFFWIMWGRYEERFSNFDFASELYERGMRYHAQPEYELKQAYEKNNSNLNVVTNTKPDSVVSIPEYNTLERLNRVNSILTQEIATDDVSNKFESLSIQFQKPKELHELLDLNPEERNKPNAQEKKAFDSPLPATPKKSSYYNLVLTPKRLFSSPHSGPALRVPVSQVPKFDLNEGNQPEAEEVAKPANNDPTVEECRKILDYLSSLVITHNLSESQSTVQNLHKYFTQFDDIKTITGLLNTPIQPTNIQTNQMEVEEKINEKNDENIEEIIQKVSESEREKPLKKKNADISDDPSLSTPVRRSNRLLAYRSVNK